MNNLLIKNLFLKSEKYINDKNIKVEEKQERLYNKFAELLILECAEVCSNFKYTEEGPSEGAAYQRALCKFAIKEHFGFETPAPLSPKVIR